MIQTDNNIPNGNNEKPYRYVFQAGHGEDIINSKTSNNKNNQNIEIVFEKAQADDAIFLHAGNDLVIQAFNNQDSVTLTDFLNPDKTNICTVTIIFDDKTLSSEDIADTITTLNNTSKNDECTDSDSNNNINKKTSSDKQYSQNSNDSLNDIASYSTLIGNSGNDILKGSDWQKDRYEYEAGHGQDVIYDQGNTSDQSQFSDVVFKEANLADAQFTRSGTDLVICAYGEDDSLTLPDYFNNSYSRAFNFIFDDKVLNVDDIAAMSFTLGGTSGDDVLRGWNSHDIIAGGPGNDKLYGGDGIDNLFGGAGNDELYGENDNDYLSGGDGDDYLDGGNGYDILIGGSGNDTLKGGDWEKDRYEFTAGHGQDVIYDQGNAGDQNQRNDIVFKGANFTDALFHRSGNNLIIKAYGNSDFVALSDYFNNDYSRAFNFIFEDQTIGAPDINNKITVTLNGDDNDNKITGHWGNDLINGGAGNDELYGNAGNDTLIGGTGNDYMKGGQGNDTYVFAKGHGQDTIYDTEGADTIQFTDVDFAEVKFRKNNYDLIIYGYNDNDSVLIQDFFYRDSYTIENFVFKDKTVTLAQLRKDGMKLYGTSGNDSISLTNGRALVYGDDGNDNITTGSSNDVLDGGAGNDNLYGNAGNDTLIGGTGNDYMEGGQGNDTYVFAKGHGQDTIYDTEGADTIQFTDVDFAEVKFRKNNYDLIIYGYNDNDSVLIQDFFYRDSYTIENFVFKDKTVTLAQLRKDGMQLYGTSGNDSISITTGRVLVYGDDGNDNITTGSSNDVLDGGAGNDNLYGNAGNDTLIGGTDNDYMEGGQGNDTYVFAKGHGQDTIYDTEGADTIQFTDVDFAEVKFRKNSYDLIIYGYNDNDSVLIQDFFYRDSYTIENFVFKDKTVTLDELCKIVITQ
jgi:Ca2+-binding RTX toxin-like protein